jgi:diadenosine tetraphosphate (Ap4A) HIT family hydrolase
VYEGTHWVVEHTYPTALLGWLVIVLRRHAAALHELSADEFHELARIQATLIPVLAQTLAAEKEYVACFAEAEHFQHVHFHVVPVTSDLPASARGSRIFSLLMVSEAQAVDRDRVRAFCESLRASLAAQSR